MHIKKSVFYIVLSLLTIYFTFNTNYAESKLTADYIIDSINMIDYHVYEISNDFYVPDEISGYFPVYLSGWQIGYDENIYWPSNITIAESNEDVILLNEIWTESIDDNRSNKRRIAVIVYLKDEIHDDMKKIISTVNALTFQISTEVSDAMNEISAMCYSELQPQIKQIRSSSDIQNCLLDTIVSFNYLTLAEEQPNVLYYAHLIEKHSQISNITCVKFKLDVSATWPIKAVLGYQKGSGDTEIVWFNSAEPIAKTSEMILYWLFANTKEEYNIDDVQSFWKKMQRQILISPEPFLIGNQIGGPYFLIQLPSL